MCNELRFITLGAPTVVNGVPGFYIEGSRLILLDPEGEFAKGDRNLAIANKR